MTCTICKISAPAGVASTAVASAAGKSSACHVALSAFRIDEHQRLEMLSSLVGGSPEVGLARRPIHDGTTSPVAYFKFK